VECPICGNFQVLPDPIIPQKARFHGYRIEEFLGMNLLWTTYLAEGYEKLSGNKVILRIPSTFFVKNIKDASNFYDIVIKAGSLNMPEFPALLDRCLLEGRGYFAFEYLENFKCIAALATGQRQIEYREALTIARNVANGLSKAWSSNLILHKNLIPSNIFTDENYNIKIKNLGIYDFLLKDYSLVKNGFNVWDYRYMSPEFIKFGKADSPLCDIYSLGAILFMLLTGKHPYDGLDFDLISDAPVPNVLDFEPDCPDEIANLVNGMMEKNEQRRISNWDELVNRFDSIILKMPQHTPTLTNIKIDFKRDLIEPVGLKPVKYGAKKKVFVLDRKQEKKDLTNTLARIVRKKLETEKLQLDRKDSFGIFLRKKLSPGLIFVFVIAVLLISFFVFFRLNNVADKILLEQKEKANTKNIKMLSETSSIPDNQLKSPEKADKEDTLSQKRILSPYEIEEQEIYKLINDAKKIIAKNSSDATNIDNAINLMHKAKERARSIKNYKLEQTIINEILELEGKKREPVEKILGELKEKVKEFIAKEDFDGAISFINSYKGPYEEETIQDRKYIVDEIIRNAEEVRKRTQAQKKEAFKKFFEVFKENAKNIICGDLSGFKASIEKHFENELLPIKDYSKSIIEQAEIYIKVPELVNDYITKAQSSSIEIKFVGRPVEKIKKVEVKDGFLFFIRDNVASPSVEQVNLDQIDPDFILEKILKISPDSKEHIFLKALVYLKSGEYKKALQNFKLIEFFSDYDESFLKKLISEYEVEKEFVEILHDCGLKSANLNDINSPQLISDIIKLEIKQDDVERIFLRLQNYKITNSGKEAYSKLDRLVEELENQCMRFDKQNKLYRQIILRGNNKSPGEALIQELHNVNPKTIIRLPVGKYVGSGKSSNAIFISQKDLSIIGEKDVYIEMNLEVNNQNIELSDLIFTGDSVAFKKDAKNVTVKNCLFPNAIITIERAENVRFENCFFRQISILNSKGIYFDHCTLTTVKKSKTDIPLKVEGDSSVEVNNSIVFGELYAILISEKVLPDRVKFNNSLLFGEEGIAAVKDKDGNIDKKTVIKKEIKLHRLCKLKNGIFEEPKFIDPINGNWILVPETPGTKAAKGGTDLGVLWEVFGKNFLLAP